jgi:hypothetical protein
MNQSKKKQKTQQHNSVAAAGGRSGAATTPDYSQKEGYVGRRVAKYFGMALYAGTIVAYYTETEMEAGVGELWHIRFDDGDKEDVGEAELIALLELYQQNRRMFFVVGNTNNNNTNSNSNPPPPGKYSILV